MNPQLSAKLQILSTLAIFMIVALHGMNVPSATIANTMPIHSHGIANSQAVDAACIPFPDLLQDLFATWWLRSGFPLLSFISGFLFFLTWPGDWQGLRRKLRARVSSVLVPFVLVSYGTIIAYAVIQWLFPEALTFARAPIREWSFYDWLENGLLTPLNYPIYFLRDVYVVFLVSALLSPILRHRQLGLVLVLILLVIWWLRIPLWPVNYRILTFFCLGAWLACHNANSLSRPMPAGWAFALVCVSLVGGWVGAWLSWSGHTWAPRDMANLTVLSGVIAIWFLYDLIPNGASIQLLLKVSVINFPLFLFHNPVVNFCTKVAQKMLPDSAWAHFTLFATLPFLVTAIITIIALSAQSLMPWPWALITGGRQARAAHRLHSNKNGLAGRRPSNLD